MISLARVETPVSESRTAGPPRLVELPFLGALRSREDAGREGLNAERTAG